jgi:peptidoglycan/LPS O-acetylase OafA/YrhL
MHSELPTKRIYGLDILRSFAILFVVYEHGYRVLNPQTVSYSTYDLFVLDGVSIFFVLSGFLIGKILIKLVQQENVTRKDIWNFWKRRWGRTLPAYFLVLTILGVYFFSIRAIRIGTLFQYYVFSQNLFYPVPWFFPETWSLSVEEWFYLLVPIALVLSRFVFKLKFKKSLLAVIVGIIALVTIYRLYRTLYHPIPLLYPQWDMMFRKQVITRLDSIMYGVLAAYISLFNKEVWSRFAKLFFFIGIVLMLTWKYIGFTAFPIYNNVFSFSLVSISAMLVLPLLAEVRTGEGVLHSFFTHVSKVSYSMYLINLVLVQDVLMPFIFKLAGKDIHQYDDGLVKYLIYLGCTFLFSFLLYKYWEQPTMALRDRYSKREV